MNTRGSGARAFVDALGRARAELAGAAQALAPDWAGAAPALLGVAPAEAVPLAGVLVAIDALQRDTWSRVAEVSSAVLERMPRELPGAPERAIARSYQVLDVNAGTPAQRCSSCIVTNGKELCIVCGGAEEGCAACEKGWIACTACDGTGRTHRATVRHVTDRLVRLRQVFLPRATPGVEEAVARWLDPDRDPPLELRIELQPTMVQSAYRGAEAAGEPELFGHRFGDAIDRAARSVRDFEAREGIVFRDVRAYGYPFYWLRYRGTPSEVALVIDEAFHPRLLAP